MNQNGELDVQPEEILETMKKAALTEEGAVSFEMQALKVCSELGKVEEDSILHLPPGVSLPTGRFGPLGANLFLYNIPLTWDRPALLYHFRTCGKVRRCRIIKDSRRGISRGFGFVAYHNHLSTLRALQMFHDLEVGAGSSKKRLRLTVKEGEQCFFIAALRALDADAERRRFRGTCGQTVKTQTQNTATSSSKSKDTPSEGTTPGGGLDVFGPGGCAPSACANGPRATATCLESTCEEVGGYSELTATSEVQQPHAAVSATATAATAAVCQPPPGFSPIEEGSALLLGSGSDLETPPQSQSDADPDPYLVHPLPPPPPASTMVPPRGDTTHIAPMMPTQVVGGERDLHQAFPPPQDRPPQFQVPPVRETESFPFHSQSTYGTSQIYQSHPSQHVQHHPVPRSEERQELNHSTEGGMLPFQPTPQVVATTYAINPQSRMRVRESVLGGSAHLRGDPSPEIASSSGAEEGNGRIGMGSRGGVSERETGASERDRERSAGALDPRAFPPPRSTVLLPFYHPPLHHAEDPLPQHQQLQDHQQQHQEEYTQRRSGGGMGPDIQRCSHCSNLHHPHPHPNQVMLQQNLTHPQQQQRQVQTHTAAAAAGKESLVYAPHEPFPPPPKYPVRNRSPPFLEYAHHHHYSKAVSSSHTRHAQIEPAPPKETETEVYRSAAHPQPQYHLPAELHPPNIQPQPQPNRQTLQRFQVLRPSPMEQQTQQQHYHVQPTMEHQRQCQEQPRLPPQALVTATEPLAQSRIGIGMISTGFQQQPPTHEMQQQHSARDPLQQQRNAPPSSQYQLPHPLSPQHPADILQVGGWEPSGDPFLFPPSRPIVLRQVNNPTSRNALTGSGSDHPAGALRDGAPMGNPCSSPRVPPLSSAPPAAAAGGSNVPRQVQAGVSGVPPFFRRVEGGSLW
uniref:RRM domain-containing protein n=1 Tax=Chromera velia CCMP2878 TaxID=1169474 RepID=A0A0G4F6T4_9ALVE|eukprot:Cvel_15493.t1-p1 / transcript=Cvel_15493.t1 / gene=Cvel_15493 / organism=Chromera_velia_CCMP2878 / gene_product=CUGBP Elav-like family member 1, putative / transcript_product=CUGBP Elav-like family member 1, putative / location=Cvel_scaffold1149:48734-51681(-) / protein_length=909 / sequence_SO=supercontig / SO=protein_coding / is_pseudo=false